MFALEPPEEAKPHLKYGFDEELQQIWDAPRPEPAPTRAQKGQEPTLTRAQKRKKRRKRNQRKRAKRKRQQWWEDESEDEPDALDSSLPDEKVASQLVKVPITSQTFLQNHVRIFFIHFCCCCKHSS